MAAHGSNQGTAIGAPGRATAGVRAAGAEAPGLEAARGMAAPRGTVMVLALYMGGIVLFWAYAYLTMLVRR